MDGTSPAPKFSQVWNDIQAKMGEKPKEQRVHKKALDKDDFLKIMINQMKYQDPTKPFDADKMMADMASITSVEQLQNINQTLTKMNASNRPMERLGMTHLIGKHVTVDKGRFPHVEGQPSSLSFQLPKDAAECTVTVVDASGEAIFEKNMGMQNTGMVSLLWDGVKANNTPAKTGDYMIRVNAKTTQGQPIPIQTTARAQVIGVSFEGGDAVLLVGDAKHQDKVRLDQVARIETDEAAAASGSAQGFPSGLGGTQIPIPNGLVPPSPGAAQAPQPASAQNAQAPILPSIVQRKLAEQQAQGFANGLEEEAPAAPLARPNVQRDASGRAMSRSEAAQSDERANMAQRVAEIAGKPNFMPLANPRNTSQNDKSMGETGAAPSRVMEVKSGELDSQGGGASGIRRSLK